ncbi:sulfotransferase family protein [Streptomyces sp. NPDC057555]|uniref:Sulfotransferase n=1 Tax=Streptomyces sp. JCM 9888 TaxID=1570103 RepID=A0A0B5H307_9ACTN|nr:sulfotransferase [Streptomyces sp. JCM 9888]
MADLGEPDRVASPVFIIGTERSGSNLLRLILNAHPSIAVPHPPHFMRYLASIERTYGDLTSETARRAATRDALALLRTHIHPWGCDVDEDTVVAAAAPSLFGVVAAVYDEYRRAQGKARWGCKSTFMVWHVDEVLAQYPGAKFVWLVRDPRDVAASAKSSVFAPYHPYRTAGLWVREQRLAAGALERHGPDVVHLLRYEDLVSRPAEEIAKLCAFLDESFDPAMLAPHLTGEAQRTSRLSAAWLNTAAPISARSVGRYQKSLTVAERRQVERVACLVMKSLSYSLSPDVHQAVRPALAEVLTRGALLRLATEYRSLRGDTNHFRRWRRDMTVLGLRARARLRAAVPTASPISGGNA